MSEISGYSEKTAQGRLINELPIGSPWRIQFEEYRYSRPQQGNSSSSENVDQQGWTHSTKYEYPNAQPITPDPQTAQLYDATSSSVVKIIRTDTLTTGKMNTLKFSDGSGFYYNRNGQIETNAHVVLPDSGFKLSELEVVDFDGTRHHARILKIDQALDLATIQLEDGATPDKIKAAQFTQEGSSPTQDWVLSHPQGSAAIFVSPASYLRELDNRTIHIEEFSRSYGNLDCAKTTMEQITFDAEHSKSQQANTLLRYLATPEYKVATHVERGSSGAPMFNARNEVEGVAALSNDDNTVGYFVRGSDARAFAEGTSIDQDYVFHYVPSKSDPKRLQLTQITDGNGSEVLPARPDPEAILRSSCGSDHILNSPPRH